MPKTGTTELDDLWNRDLEFKLNYGTFAKIRICLLFSFLTIDQTYAFISSSFQLVELSPYITTIIIIIIVTTLPISCTGHNIVLHYPNTHVESAVANSDYFASHTCTLITDI